MTRILKADQLDPSSDIILEGARIIKGDGLVVFPTETVYGLGANAFSEAACRKIFAAKNRPADNPLIVHISDIEMIGEVAEGITEALMEKLGRIWPGPVTLLFRKSHRIPYVVTGGSELVAVRMPSSIFALRLIEASGVPLAAPSANISTRPSITDSRHAISELNGRVDLIYDAGPTHYGLESTIIDISGEHPVLLRAGSKSVEELEEIFGKITVTDFSRGLSESAVPLAPGMKYRHYSPDRTIFIASQREVAEELAISEKFEGKMVMLGSDELCDKSRIRCIPLGSEFDLDKIAHNLFSAFRSLEELQEQIAVIMPFPENGPGLAIMNRIRKAASGKISSVKEAEVLLKTA